MSGSTGKKKAQSAIEYLMTYGWMLLVVAVVGGAVFSVVGDQSIESVSGFDSQSVNVQDFGVSIENGLMFSLNDPIGQATVTEVIVSNPDSSNITYVVNQDISEENMVNLPGIIPGDGDNELEVEIIYDSGNLENLTTSGTVTGTLEVDENFNDRTIITDGLVGYWPLGERYSLDSTVYDLTTNNNHGEKINSPTAVDSILGGQALEFDGSESVNLGKDHKADISVTEDFSISIWANGGEDVGGYIIAKRDSGYSHSNGWLIDHQGSEIQTTVGDSTQYSISDGISTNKWIHIVLSNNGMDEHDVYVDGEPKGSFPSGSGDEDNARIIVGARDLTSYQFNDGKIDDVRIYNRALSSNEVESIYEQRSVE